MTIPIVETPYEPVRSGIKGGLMDRITNAQLSLFAKEYELDRRSEEDQFEHFSAFATVKRHYDRTFAPADIVVGSGGDTGIDAIAIIVNNVLVTDVDSIDELATNNGYLDVTFIFVQSERSSSFDGMKIMNLTAGIVDFFEENPRLVRNENIREASLVKAAIYDRLTMFRQRPDCICYYVTTGKWQNDQNLIARKTIAVEELDRLQVFGNVEFQCFGADEIQRAYNQTRSPISREFRFPKRIVIPEVQGVRQAFLGYIPVSEFRRIVSDESGNEILGSVFEGNVRDWQDYTPVNTNIKETLNSDVKDRFVLMNNGITIIAKIIKQVSDRFTIEDFQVVNGCQTSHVVFNEHDLDDSV